MHIRFHLQLQCCASPRNTLSHCFTPGCVSPTRNPPPQTPLTFPQHSHTLTQVDSITDSNQGLLLDVAEGRELPKAEAENLQKRRKLIKLE